MPSRTIELFEPTTWREAVAEVVAVHIPPPVSKHLRRVAGEDMFHDTMDYLTGTYGAAGDFLSDDRLATLREAVLAQFGFFRCYHGCRPLSFDSYFREGLQPLTRERLAALAFDLFEGSIPKAEIDDLSRRTKLNTREGQIYFTADKDEQAKKCGHYMIYGPEALCCLWRDEHDRTTPRFLESRRRHRTRGIPTIFTCDVPLALVKNGWRRELADTLITQFFQLASARPVTPREWSRNWAFAIEKPLPPEYLRAHEHPAVITDPLDHNSAFRNEFLTCPRCTPQVAPVAR